MAHPTNGQPLQDIRLSYTFPWPEQHVKSLRSAYNGSPFYEHYSPAIDQILNQKHVFLLDMIEASLTFCLVRLKKETQIVKTVKKSFKAGPDNPFIDNITYPTGINYAWPRIQPYHGVFGTGFDIQTSVLDALFCAGPSWLAGQFAQYDQDRLQMKL